MVIFEDAGKSGRNQSLAQSDDVTNENASTLVQMVSGNLDGSDLEIKEPVAEIARYAEFAQPRSCLLAEVIGNLEVNMIRGQQFLTSPAGVDDVDEFL